MAITFGKRKADRSDADELLRSTLENLQIQQNYPQPDDSVGEFPTQVITTSNWGHNAAPDQCPPDVDGISRLFPLSMFAGERGEMLRATLRSPNSRLNVAQTTETFATLDRRKKGELNEIVAGINEACSKLHTDVPIRAGFILPERLWRGKYRNFMCAAGQFYPADPTNIFFFAATPFAAEKNGLPVDFDYNDDHIYESCEKLIAIVGEKYLAAKTGFDADTRDQDNLLARIRDGLKHDKQVLKEWTDIIRQKSPESEHVTIAEEGLRTLGSIALHLRFDFAKNGLSNQIKREGEFFGLTLYRSYPNLRKAIESARSYSGW